MRRADRAGGADHGQALGQIGSETLPDRRLFGIDPRQDVSDKLEHVLEHPVLRGFPLPGEVVVMNKGRIQQVGTPIEIYDRPANSFVAGLTRAPFSQTRS